jgi:hypothetical protein
MTRIMAFTIMRDEPLYGPIWRKYYGRAGDTMVYDPRSEPGLPLELGSPESERMQIEFVGSAIKRFLDVGYDVVMCPDVDEFLIPNNGQSLRQYCEMFDGQYAHAHGYNVVQQPGEPPVDFSDTLSNRAVSFSSLTYSKVILTRTPLCYGPGRHYAYIDGQRLEAMRDDLDLVHLKFIDFELDFARWLARAEFSPGMRKFSREQFESLYSRGIDPIDLWIYWEGAPLAPKPHWRNALRLSNPVESVSGRADISKLLEQMDAKRICEVGVRRGEHLRNLLVPCVAEAVAVDMWRETGKRSENDACLSQEELDAQCESVGNIDRRVLVNRAPSILAAMSYPPEHFDFVYIDADHTESAVAADLRVWWPRVRRGGVLAGHDYYEVSAVCADGTELTFGVVAAVNRFVTENNLQLRVDADGDWFIEK